MVVVYANNIISIIHLISNNFHGAVVSLKKEHNITFSNLNLNFFFEFF